MPNNWPKVEELYHVALEKAPAEREAFLDQACGEDEELRREVQSLLGHEREAERLMEQPAPSAATQRLAVVRGTRLGPYEVGELIGSGGMGEVYRARDPRLGRDVAIKVLPEEVSHDAAALTRFDREARAVAALSHPHIAAVFDIGETDGTHYLVMELLEGEMLAARLKRGPLPEKDALRIGAEIAEALGAAHGKGVVHRDVKPQNVMLTKAGVKLLDFGLARLLRRADVLGEATAATSGVHEGVLAGTLPYMAPEQLEGREADARTDIWALGCVLFEMFAGKRAFEGDSQAKLIAAIEKDVAPAMPSAVVSPAVERLVRQCLQSDPDDRWQSARDLARRLREVADLGTVAETRPARWRTRWAHAPLIASAVMVALLAGAVVGRLWQPPSISSPPTRILRSQIDLPPDQPLLGWERDQPERTVLALSPDGTLLVWAARTSANPLDWALYLRRLQTGETTRIPGGDKGIQPFFSPNGHWIGFTWLDYGLRLRKIPVEGGLPVDLAELPPGLESIPVGACWGPDDRIYLGSYAGGLLSVPADGGPPREITTLDRAREAGHRLPSLLPGGRDLLVTVAPLLFGLKDRIEIFSLATGKRKVVVEDGADGRYLPSGHLVFVRQGVLMAAPFDLSRLELVGPAVAVVEAVSQALNAGNLGAAQYAVSDSGLLAYASGGMFPDAPVELLLVDEKGRTEPLPGFDRPLVSPQLSFSPDGRLMAFNDQERTGRIWLFDVERHTYRGLSDRGIATTPRWSPDGKRLAVGWSEAGPPQIWIVPAERGDWKQLTKTEHTAWSPSWSPDGRFLAFVEFGATGEILVHRFDDGKTVPFVATGAAAGGPEFSPDGRWLAYTSDESGRQEVYVTSFPGREKTLTVSREGGLHPAWSPDGRRLYYEVDTSGQFTQFSMMAVSMHPGAELSLGIPTQLFRLPKGFVYLAMRPYALHPDGRHFVIGRYVKTEPPPPITRLELVQNWFAVLEGHAPTRR